MLFEDGKIGDTLNIQQNRNDIISYFNDTHVIHMYITGFVNAIKNSNGTAQSADMLRTNIKPLDLGNLLIPLQSICPLNIMDKTRSG